MKTRINLSAIGFVLLFSLSNTLFAMKFELANAESVNSGYLWQQEPGKYGEDSATCIVNLSLYREFYKQWRASGYTSKAINDAITPWRWVFFNCPMALKIPIWMEPI